MDVRLRSGARWAHCEGRMLASQGPRSEALQDQAVPLVTLALTSAGRIREALRTRTPPGAW